MRFLDSEKIFIILLYFLNVKAPSICKIINGFRSGKDKNDMCSEFGSKCDKIKSVIQSYIYAFDPQRNKPTNKVSIGKVITKWNQLNTIENQKRQYSTKLSEERIQHLCNFVRESLQNRKLTLNELKSVLELPVGKSSISNYLRKNDLGAYVQRKTIVLFPVHRRKRLEFANQHINKPLSFWLSTIFTDEKTFQSYSNGRTYIRRSKSESKDVNLRKPCDKSNRFKVNIWGYLCSKGFGIFYVEKDMDQFEYLKILKNCCLNKMDELFGDVSNYQLLQDNFKGHKTPAVTSYLKVKKVQVIDFPPRSPDINLIELFWAALQKNVNR